MNQDDPSAQAGFRVVGIPRSSAWPAAPFHQSSLSDLHGMRIIKTNLLYLTGLDIRAYKEEQLRKKAYLGQYGNIKKIILKNEPKDSGINGVYVTYSQANEASIAILALDQFSHENKTLRAFYGSTKYCKAFLQGIYCTKKECPLQHEQANEYTFHKEIAFKIVSQKVSFFNSYSQTANAVFPEVLSVVQQLRLQIGHASTNKLKANADSTKAALIINVQNTGTWDEDLPNENSAGGNLNSQQQLSISSSSSQDQLLRRMQNYSQPNTGRGFDIIMDTLNGDYLPSNPYQQTDALIESMLALNWKGNADSERQSSSNPGSWLLRSKNRWSPSLITAADDEVFNGINEKINTLVLMNTGANGSIEEVSQSQEIEMKSIEDAKFSEIAIPKSNPGGGDNDPMLEEIELIFQKFPNSLVNPFPVAASATAAVNSVSQPMIFKSEQNSQNSQQVDEKKEEEQSTVKAKVEFISDEWSKEINSEKVVGKHQANKKLITKESESVVFEQKKEIKIEESFQTVLSKSARKKKNLNQDISASKAVISTPTLSSVSKGIQDNKNKNQNKQKLEDTKQATASQKKDQDNTKKKEDIENKEANNSENDLDSGLKIEQSESKSELGKKPQTKTNETKKKKKKGNSQKQQELSLKEEKQKRREEELFLMEEVNKIKKEKAREANLAKEAAHAIQALFQKQVKKGQKEIFLSEKISIRDNNSMSVSLITQFKDPSKAGVSEQKTSSQLQKSTQQLQNQQHQQQQQQLLLSQLQSQQHLQQPHQQQQQMHTCNISKKEKTIREWLYEEMLKSEELNFDLSSSIRLLAENLTSARQLQAIFTSEDLAQYSMFQKKCAWK